MLKEYGVMYIYYMSWDVFLFNSKQKIDSIEEVDDEQFEPTDFDAVFEEHFKQIDKEDKHRRIIGSDFSIEYFFDDSYSGHTMLNLYGENALYELIFLAKKHHWQIFDTGNGEMVDLDNPTNNGYDGYQEYLRQILAR